MRKVFFSILAAAIVLSTSTGTVYAAGAGNRCYFVDADGDGICDNCERYHRHGAGGGNFVDEDGDGICDNYTSGGNFVDADGDGICDNYTSGRACGRGRGCGSRGRRGR